MATSQILYFQAIHPFQGDKSTNQLSFPAGATLRVNAQPDVIATSEGWTWGSTPNEHGQEVYGWFPTNYAVLTAAPSSRPSLPWIKETQNRDDENEGDFTGHILGGTSPALDYSSSNPTFRNTHDSNPFAQQQEEQDGPFAGMNDHERITIVDTPKKRPLMGKRLQKGWQKVESAGSKWIPRRRARAEDPLVPSISITPSNQ